MEFFCPISLSLSLFLPPSLFLRQKKTTLKQLHLETDSAAETSTSTRTAPGPAPGLEELEIFNRLCFFSMACMKEFPPCFITT